MKHKKNIPVKGIGLTLLGAMLWGVCGSCGQYLFQYREVTSNWLVPIRLSSAGLLILMGLLVRQGREVFGVWREKTDRRDIVIFAVFGMMLCQYSYFTTIQYSNAGTATVLQYTGPAMILVWTCIRMGRKPKRYELAALFCSMFGTFILATHGDLHSLAILPQALVWGMISAVTLVVYTLQPARLMRKYSTLLVLGWGMFLGGLTLMVLMRPWTLKVIVDGGTLLAMGFIVAFGTVTAFYCYLTGVKLAGATSASMLACIEPVAATIVSVIWLKVQFQAVDLAGFVFVLSTVFIISLCRDDREEEKHG